MTGDEETSVDPTTQALRAILEASEVVAMMAWVRQAAAGYRDELIASGFNETAAEMMAVHFHMHILETVRKTT